MRYTNIHRMSPAFTTTTYVQFRAASMLVTRAAAVAIVVLLLNTQAVLHAPALMLSLCAALCACGVYFHAQIEGVTSTAHDMLPLPHDEEY
jgi:hypothetical protein